MDTALLEPGFTRTGSGQIRSIFGDFSQDVAHILFEDNSLIHLHGRPGLDAVLKQFGTLSAASGRRIRYTADSLGVVLELEAA